MEFKVGDKVKASNRGIILEILEIVNKDSYTYKVLVADKYSSKELSVGIGSAPYIDKTYKLLTPLELLL